MRWFLSGVVSLSILCSAQAGFAQNAERDRARLLATEGLQSFEKGQFEEALRKLVAAEESFHAPPHLLFIARAQARLGQLIEARDTYRKLGDESLGASSPQPFRDAQATGRAEMEALSPRIPKIELVVEGAPRAAVEFSIDGKSVVGPDELQAVNPGSRVITARAAGYETATVTLPVAERDLRKAILSLRPGQGDEETSTDGPLLWPAWTLIGVGAVGLGVGAVTGFIHLSKVSDVEERNDAGEFATEDELEAAKDDARPTATIATVGLIAGGVLAAGGVVWLIVAPDASAEASSARVSVAPGLGSLSISGTF